MKKLLSVLLLLTIFGFHALNVYAATQYSILFASASSQYATGGNYIDNPTNMTISFWIKNSDTTSTQMLVTKINTTSTNGQGWVIFLTVGTLGWLIQQWTTTYVYVELVANSTYNDGAWHHIVATKTGNAINLYVDNSDIAVTSYSDGTISTITTSKSVIVGQVGNIDAGQYANARIDDVRIWTRVLDTTEIGNLYADGCTFSNGSSLEAWWNFDNDYNDSSGNSRTLTPTNTPTFSSADVPYATCAAAATVTAKPQPFLIFE